MRVRKGIKRTGIFLLMASLAFLSWIKQGGDFLFPSVSFLNATTEEGATFLEPLDQVEPESPKPVLKKIKIRLPEDTASYFLIRDPAVYMQGWDTLPQPIFWRSLMHIAPSLSIVNIAANRTIVDTVDTRTWDRKSKRQQESILAELREENGLEKDAEIYITSGRNHFYRFREVVPNIDAAIPIFEAEEVNPWYAQSILLIESPGKMRRSTAGAHGSFQLMKSVARQMGLKVNRQLDERKDFGKSAKAAARFLKRVCIKEARRMLENQGIAYNEDALWFRMLVLHIYHAGARNVAGALRQLSYTEGNPQLILDLWQTNYRNFGNASQNYTQIVLAALLEIDHMVLTEGEIVW